VLGGEDRVLIAVKPAVAGRNFSIPALDEPFVISEELLRLLREL
jgi:hypothetical protein